MPLGPFLLTLFSLLLTAVLHGVACHTALAKRWMPQQLATRCSVVAAILLTGVAVYWAEPTPSPLNTLAFSFLMVAGSAHVYFHFFNMSETARRIRILMAFTSDKKLSLENGADASATDRGLRIRLKRLTVGGQIKEAQGKFHATNSILLWAAVILNGYTTLLFPPRFQAQPKTAEKFRRTGDKF